jgi:hypothetical protein
MVLSSHSRWRRQIVLRPEVKKGFVAAKDGAEPERMTWSRLLGCADSSFLINMDHVTI